MDIGRLTSGILAEARAEAKAITDAAKAEKSRTLDEEKRKVSLMLAGAEEEAGRFVAAQERERIAWAKLEAKKISGEAREFVVRDAMDILYKQLASFRRDARYGNFLNARVASAIRELSTPKPVVHICRGDSKLLKGVNAKVVEDLSGMGGAIVESADGSVRVDYTLETLFEDKRELLRKKVYERMFR
ncbi:V-type ATP synthase subunit E [Candidatus Micrarchaeota archaeon]|nr:V-type ATP synthase subunit E [Candidatus Micrarchaeota archaeon]